MSRPDGTPFDAMLAHLPWARALARDLVKDVDQAEDLVQEVWMRAMQRPPRNPGALRSWIASVMKNSVAEHGRRESRRSALVQRIQPQSAAAPTDSLERLETAQQLGAIVRDLAEPMRTAILLRYFDDLSVREVARRLGISTEAAESRIRRGRDLIQAELRQRGDCDQWLPGLLLLAWPVAAKTSVTTLALGVAATLALFLLLPALLSRGVEPDPTPTTLQASAVAAMEPPPSLSAGAPALVEEALERAPAAQQRRLSILAAVPANDRAPASFTASLTFLDERLTPIETRSVVSRGGLAAEAELPPRAAFLEARITAEPGWSDLGAPMRAPLDPYAPKQEIRVPLRVRVGEATGILRDASGAPLADAPVGVWYDEGFRRGEPPAFIARSEADGRFRVGPLFAQSLPVYLAPHGEGWTVLRGFHGTGLPASGLILEGVELRAETAREARFLAMDEAGLPVAGATFAVHSAAAPTAELPPPEGEYLERPARRTVTGADGWTVPLALGPGEWIADVHGEGRVAVRQLLAARENELQVMLPRARELSGTLVGPDGAPLPEARVLAIGGGRKSETWTDAAGRWSLARPGAEDQEVRLIWFPQTPGVAARVSEPFLPEATGWQRHDELEPGHSFRLQMVDESGAPWTERTPLRLVWRTGRTVRVPDGDEREDCAEALSGRMAPLFGFPALPEAPLPAMPAEPIEVQVWSPDRGLLASTRFTPGAEEIVTLRAGSRLGAAASWLVQAFAEEDGASLESFRVQLRRTEPGADTREIPDVLVRGADGELRLDGLEPGLWNLFVEAPLRSPWLIRGVELVAGAELRSRVELAPGADALISLRLPNGAPAAAARVQALREDGTPQPLTGWHDSAYADGDGRVLLEGLPLSAPIALRIGTVDGRWWSVPPSVYASGSAPQWVTLRE